MSQVATAVQEEMVERLLAGLYEKDPEKVVKALNQLFPEYHFSYHKPRHMSLRERLALS